MIRCQQSFNPLPKARLEAVDYALPINLQVLGVQFALSNIVAIDVACRDRLAFGNATCGTQLRLKTQATSMIEGYWG